MKRIVVALDFGPSTDSMLSFAGHLARDFNADLQLVHVHRLFSDHGFTTASFIEEKEILEELQRAASEIDAQATKSVKTAYTVSYDTIESSVLNSANDADLILLGQTSNTGIWRFIVGDVSEGIIERATCPILIVPHEAVWTAPFRITVAADRYEVPDSCVSFLKQVKDRYKSKVNVFHRSGLPLMELPEASSAKFKAIGAHVQEEYSFDSLTNYLLDCAKKTESYWLTVIHHRRPRWKEWLSRNHSEKVADVSPIPVLILPDVDPKPEPESIQTAAAIGFV
ncbi:MAG: universal stress protein [Saprospiraceae bacterium]